MPRSAVLLAAFWRAFCHPFGRSPHPYLDACVGLLYGALLWLAVLYVVWCYWLTQPPPPVVPVQTTTPRQDTPRRGVNLPPRPLQQATPLGRPGVWRTVWVSAYSPKDACDGWHWSTWDTVTADGTDWSEEPYGIAAPFRGRNPLAYPYGTKIYIPEESGYLPSRKNRVFTVDDTGSKISRWTRQTGQTHLDLRYKHSSSALAFMGGQRFKTLRIFIFTDKDT